MLSLSGWLFGRCSGRIFCARVFARLRSRTPLGQTALGIGPSASVLYLLATGWPTPGVGLHKLVTVREEFQEPGRPDRAWDGQVQKMLMDVRIIPVFNACSAECARLSVQSRHP